MRVLVTGGTGFVGRYLVRLLRGHRQSIYVTSLEKETAPSDGLSLLKCDLRVPKSVRSAVVQVRPDRVYHLAAQSSVPGSFQNAKDVYDTNFLGTLHLLEAVREHALHARVLLVGSGQCYGSVPPGHLPITESEPLRPESPYGVSKAAADILGYQFSRSHALHVVRTRPFNHTGPGQSTEFVCSDFACQIAAIGLGLHPPLLEVGDLRAERDFSDVRDVVRAYELLLESGQPGEVYNVASGKPTSIGEIVRLLTSFCPKTIRLSVQKNRLRPGQARALYGSNRKLRRATGWKPKYSLETTLKDLYLYWEQTLRSQKS